MKPLTKTMKQALEWLAHGNEVSISLIRQIGYSSEMPRRATLQALLDRGLVDFRKYLGGFDVTINDAGRAVVNAKRA